jgi:selenocysteine lyase/cysteine desulfurase
MPVYGAQYTLEASLALLESFGTDVVEATVAARVERVIAALGSLGLATLASPDVRRRAGIVVFEADDAEGIADALARHDVFVWGRERRVRISPHLYTSAADLDVLVERLAEISAGH